MQSYPYRHPAYHFELVRHIVQFFLTQFLQDVLTFSAIQTGAAFLPMAGALFAAVRAVPRFRFRPSVCRRPRKTDWSPARAAPALACEWGGR